MSELTEGEREALANEVLGGATPSPLMVRAVERIIAARVAKVLDDARPKVNAAIVDAYWKGRAAGPPDPDKPTNPDDPEDLFARIAALTKDGGGERG